MKIYFHLSLFLLLAAPCSFAQQFAAPQQNIPQDRNSPDAALSSAAKACADGNRALCKTLYLQAAQTGVAPQQLKSYSQLALLEQESGNMPQALDYWTKAITADSQDAFARLMRGWAYLALGKAKAAADDFSMTISLTANQALIIDARIGSGIVQLAQGDDKKAAETFQGLYIRDPYTIALTSYLAAEAFYRQNRLEPAMIYVQQSLKHDAQNPTAQILQAVLSEKIDRPIAAWQAYSSLAELDPQDSDIAEHMASLAKKMNGDPSKYSNHVRLRMALGGEPRLTPSPKLRVAVYSGNTGRPAELTNLEFVSNSSFTISDVKFGPVASAKPERTWFAQWNPAKSSIEIKDNWNNPEHSSLRPITLEPDPAGGSILIKNAKPAAPLPMDYGDRELRGTIALMPGASGFYVIDSVNSEDFLPGALAAASENDTPEEALKALAIVLRTRIADIAAKNAAMPYDMPDNASGIYYRGTNIESGAVTDAVDSTRGQTVVGIDTAAIGIGYETACGGASSSGAADTARDMRASTPLDVAQKILNNPPPDLICSPEDPTLWSTVKWAVFLEPAAIERRLSADGKFGRLKGMEISKRDDYGRALAMHFIGSDGTADISGPAAISRVLSGGTLRSTVFYIMPFYSGSRITRMLVRGLGTGDGAGMCMHGAREMAQSGADYRAILRKYFPGVSIAGVPASKIIGPQQPAQR
jgi:stage II sporulation protein D